MFLKFRKSEILQDSKNIQVVVVFVLLFKMPLSSGFVNEFLAVSIELEDFRDVLLLLFKFCIVGDDVFCSVE